MYFRINELRIRLNLLLIFRNGSIMKSVLNNLITVLILSAILLIVAIKLYQEN